MTITNENRRNEIIAKIQVKKELERREAKKTLSNFTEYVYNGRWERVKHLVFLQEKVEQLIDGELYNEKGEEADVLCLSLPPQHGKSMSLTEVVPAYIAMQREYFNVLLVAYSMDLSRTFNRQNRTIIEEHGRQLYGVEMTKTNDEHLILSNHSSIKQLVCYLVLRVIRVI